MRMYKSPLKTLSRKKTPKVFYKKIWIGEHEIPNDDLIRAIRKGEEELKSGKLKSYSNVDDMMRDLEKGL